MMVKYLRDVGCHWEDQTKKLWKVTTYGAGDISPYVVTLSIGHGFAAETLVFWADRDGTILDFDELGGVPATYSHYGALKDAGIGVVDND